MMFWKKQKKPIDSSYFLFLISPLSLCPMARIRPFRAWRYNTHQVGELNEQFSPLFDVVNEAQLQALYQKPYNSIHLSVPRSHDETVKRLRNWKQTGVLEQDKQPSLYVYYQYFTLYGERKPLIRKGFIAMIEAKEGDIILHEDTITHSVANRVKLLSRTQLNVAPTHGLYPDPNHELESLMDWYIEQQAIYHYIDYQGVINKLALISDPAHIARFEAKLAEQPVYLADGHHRLESSKVFRDELAQQGKLGADDMANYHMMYLTNLYAEGLQILPTHRVYFEEEKIDLAAIRSQLSDYFTIEDVSRSRKSIVGLLKGKDCAFGMVSLGRKWLLQPKQEIDLEKEISLNLPSPLKKLSYTILHYLIFDKILKIPYAEQNKSRQIAYEKDYARAISLVNTSKAKLAFITQGVQMETMLEICDTGYKMPQKSTYFYPKVVCGLVFGTINQHET